MSAPHPDPGMIFGALNAYQRSMALKTGIELDVFSAIGRGEMSVEAIAKAVGASERGIRILCDFLVNERFLTKVFPSLARGGVWGMLWDAGYTGVERHDLKRSAQTVILG